MDTTSRRDGRRGRVTSSINSAKFWPRLKPFKSRTSVFFMGGRGSYRVRRSYANPPAKCPSLGACARRGRRERRCSVLFRIDATGNHRPRIEQWDERAHFVEWVRWVDGIDGIHELEPFESVE